MAQPKSSTNIVSFPGSDSDSETDRTISNSSQTDRVDGEFEIKPVAAPTGTPAEIASAMFEIHIGADKAERIGPFIASVREAQGQTVDGIAGELKFDPEIITAIETMALEKMPKGFRAPRILTYTRALHLPADDVLAIYREQSPSLEGTRIEPQVQAVSVDPDRLKRPSWALPVAMAGGLAVCVAGLMVLTGGGDDAAPTVPTMSDGTLGGTAARTELPPFDSAAAAMQGDYTALPLTLVAVRDGWVEVRGANGTLFRDRQMRAGEVYFPRVGAGWTVSARDGGAFEWRVGDVVVGSLGTNETSVYAESVDLIARQALKTVAPTLAASDALPPRH